MADCACAGDDGWEAWHDRMPGKPQTLHVRGTCSCPTPGYELRLERHEPQGVNPGDLLLRLVEIRPGPQPEVITPTSVDYREETEARYDTVSIVPDGPASIPVREVS